MVRLITACMLLFLLLFPTTGFSSISEEVREVISGQLSETTDAGQMAVELSELTAVHLYNLDEEQMEQTLLVMLRANRRLQAVKIVDYATQEVLVSLYRNDSESLVRGDFPDFLEQSITTRECGVSETFKIM